MTHSTTHDIERLVLISLLPGLDPEQRMHLCSEPMDARHLHAMLESIIQESTLSPMAASRLRLAAKTLPDRLVCDQNLQALFLGEPGYPQLLAEIADPPFMLLSMGHLPDATLQDPWIAIVGTRSMHARSSVAACKLALEAADAGCIVVSGFAHGIDQAAHVGAIEAGGTTIAILGSGHDHIFPHDTKLINRILDAGGSFISEFLPDDLPLAWHFPQRNRIISGISQLSTIIEASITSGAMSTADHALRQGRDVVVHAGSLSIRESTGTHRLHEDGSPAIASYTDLCLLNPCLPPGLTAVELPIKAMNHGNRMLLERNHRVVRFGSTWISLEDGDAWKQE